jgi:hypothetical protein
MELYMSIITVCKQRTETPVSIHVFDNSKLWHRPIMGFLIVMISPLLQIIGSSHNDHPTIMALGAAIDQVGEVRPRPCLWQKGKLRNIPGKEA